MTIWIESLLKRKRALLVILSFLITTLVFLHMRAVNGAWYFKWSWQRLNAAWAFGVTLLGVLPFFVGQALYRRWSKQNPSLTLRVPCDCLLLVSLSTFLLGLLCTISYRQPRGLHRISHIVESHFITSYYTIAARFAEGAEAKPPAQLLREYPDLMPSFPFHGLTKPPGPVLFYYLLARWLGTGSRTALAGGLLVGLLAAMGVPMVFLLLRRLLEDAEAAFCGASFYAPAPCLAAFFGCLWLLRNAI